MLLLKKKLEKQYIRNSSVNFTVKAQILSEI